MFGRGGGAGQVGPGAALHPPASGPPRRTSKKLLLRPPGDSSSAASSSTSRRSRSRAKSTDLSSRPAWNADFAAVPSCSATGLAGGGDHDLQRSTQADADAESGIIALGSTSTGGTTLVVDATHGQHAESDEGRRALHRGPRAGEEHQEQLQQLRRENAMLRKRLDAFEREAKAANSARALFDFLREEATTLECTSDERRVFLLKAQILALEKQVAGLKNKSNRDHLRADGASTSCCRRWTKEKLWALEQELRVFAEQLVKCTSTGSAETSCSSSTTSRNNPARRGKAKPSWNFDTTSATALASDHELNKDKPQGQGELAPAASREEVLAERYRPMSKEAVLELAERLFDLGIDFPSPAEHSDHMQVEGSSDAPAGATAVVNRRALEKWLLRIVSQQQAEVEMAAHHSGGGAEGAVGGGCFGPAATRSGTSCGSTSTFGEIEIPTDLLAAWRSLLADKVEKQSTRNDLKNAVHEMVRLVGQWKTYLLLAMSYS